MPVLGLAGGQAPEVARRPPRRPGARPGPLPSTKTTDGSAHAPVTTSASIPARFAAIAKCDDASASQSRPVSGLSATTANLAEVVSGLPTSGLSAKTRAASGPSGSTPAGVSWATIQVPRPTPPRNPRRTDSSSGTQAVRPGRGSIRR